MNEWELSGYEPEWFFCWDVSLVLSEQIIIWVAMRRAPPMMISDLRVWRLTPLCLSIPNCCSSAPRSGKGLTAKSTKEGLSLLSIPFAVCFFFCQYLCLLISFYIMALFNTRYGTQIVAIKILHRGSKPDEKSSLQSRFIREVNMMSRVQHHNLVKVSFFHLSSLLAPFYTHSICFFAVHWSLQRSFYGYCYWVAPWHVTA